MIGVLSILISAGIIGLIVWLKVVAEHRRQKRLPERRRKALAALAPLVNGRVDDAGLTGAWEGFPLEAANQMPQHPRDLRRWRITLGIPPGGEDWRLVDVPIVGYMFQTGDRIGAEVPMEKASRGGDTQLAWNRAEGFRKSYAPQLAKGQALVSRLGDLRWALTGDVRRAACFALPGAVSYQAQSGKLTYDSSVVGRDDIPNPRQFADQLKMLSALRDAAALPAP
jgi:hypothetical protein